MSTSQATGTTILILGARSPVALDLARACYRTGIRVHLADPMRFPITTGSRAGRFHRVASPRFDFAGFRRDLLAIVERYGVTDVVPTCEESFYLSKMKREFPEGVHIHVADFPTIERLHNKAAFNAWMISLGFPVPKTEVFASGTELGARLSECAPDSRWVLKPAYSRFAAKARIGLPGELGKTVGDLAPTDTNPVLLQEFIEGTEYCTYAFADAGRVLAVSTYRHDFKVGAGAGISFEPVLHSGIEKWIEDFAEMSGVDGQISFDFIERDGVLFPLECNPRATSGIHLLTPDLAFARLFDGAIPQAVIRPRADRRSMLFLAMLFFGLPSIRSFARAVKWVRVMLVSRDVIFDWRDPAPFLFQFLTFGSFIIRSFARRISQIEATTEDIEWNGEPIPS